jgi:hypothetical protein
LYAWIQTDSKSYDETWSYAAIIGKLNYLENSTRPDIAYTVHPCARFTSDPKVEHTKAVKAIDRYLAATKEKGLIFTPNICNVMQMRILPVTGIENQHNKIRTLLDLDRVLLSNTQDVRFYGVLSCKETWLTVQRRATTCFNC